MTLQRPSVGEVLVALLCSGWAAGLLAPDWSTAAVWMVLVGLAVLPHRRRPEVAAIAVAALLVWHQWSVGTPSENPWPLAAVFVTTYALGRRAGPTARGVVPLVVLVAGFAAADPMPPSIVFSFVLLGSVWGFGYLVRRRTAQAQRAAAEAYELAGTDPATRAAEVVAEERARLAGAALGVVRGAVATMLAQARAAEAELDTSSLQAIQVEGRRAMVELRRLLGLLRSEPDGGHVREESPPPNPPWLVDLAVACGVAALTVIEVVLSPEHQPEVVPVGLALLLAATVALRRLDPALACVLAIVPPVLAAALGVPLPLGLWTAVAVAILAWSAASHGRPRDHAALWTLAGVLLLEVNRNHPGNEAMLLAITVLAAIAGHLWATRGREERSAEAAATRLRAEHAEVAERAVRAERVRLARDLHDVASHAVGVMVLQTGAAAAQRTQDPARAREALEAVKAAGTQALSELEVLFRLLDAGAVGSAGHAAKGQGTDLQADLQALAGRVRAAGLDVTLEIDHGAANDPVVAATTYRVIQEALTNAIRYAPGATVEVTVGVRGGAVEVTVRDDGAGTPVVANSGGGFGLVGLEERLHSHGGELTAGPQPDGSFEVRARLPMRSSELRA